MKGILKRVTAFVTLCLVLIASLPLGNLSVEAASYTSKTNKSRAFVKETGKFDILHYAGVSGGSFNLPASELKNSKIIGVYINAYIRTSGHLDNAKCNCGIEKISIKGSGVSKKLSSDRIYVDRRYQRLSDGSTNWSWKTYGMLCVDATDTITSSGTYKVSPYVWTDKHESETAGEIFSAWEVFVLVEKPDSPIATFGIVQAAKSGYFVVDKPRYLSTDISVSTGKLKVGGGKVNIWTVAAVDAENRPKITCSIDDKAVLADQSKLDSYKFYNSDSNLYEYSYAGKANVTGSTLSLEASNIGGWSTCFGMTYYTECAAPTFSDTMSMSYDDGNNPENGITVSGTIKNKTPHSKTGLQKPTLIVEVDSGLNIESATVKKGSSKATATINGNQVIVQFKGNFMPDNTITFSIKCKQKSSASQASFTAKNELRGDVISLGNDTNQPQSVTANTEMNALYKVTVTGDSHTSNVSVGGTSNITSVSRVFGYNSNINIAGIAATGYHVNSWSDGNLTGSGTSSSTRSITVISMTSLSIGMSPNTYYIDYAKGLTDCPSSSIPASTTATYDSNVAYSAIGSLLGRSYTVNFKANIPAVAPNPSSCTIKDSTETGHLESTGYWSIGGVNVAMGSATTTPPNHTAAHEGRVTATATWKTKTFDNFKTGKLDGFMFEGWYDAPTGGNKITNLSVTPATTTYSKTVYAHWRGIPYKVVYKAGDGGKGSDITETWTYGENHNLFNNTPQLSGTAGYGEPHFTREGYYIDYWILSATGTRNTSLDKGNIPTGTGYYNDTAVSSTQTYAGNLICPQEEGCVVTLTAHWAPIKYKVQYNNDTTSVSGKGYQYSTDTLLTSAYDFGTSYNFVNFEATRSNKYGKSLWLGYGISNGDTTKNPKYYQIGKSPSSYATHGGHTAITATDFVGLSTTDGTAYSNYFKYLNNGSVKTFNIYCVWDDVPGIEPIDLQWGGNATDGNSILFYDKQSSSYTKSGLLSEYMILSNADIKGSVWDREDALSQITGDSSMKNHYYINGFKELNIRNQKTYENGQVEPTSYELHYTVVDSNGNTYSTSRKLYVGNLANIMVGGSKLQQ